MSHYLLSVDGGGTKTVFCLYDIDKDTFETISTGPSSFKSIGREKALHNTCEGLKSIMAKCDATLEEIKYGVWGMSGYDTPDDGKVFEQMITEAGLSLQNNTVISDALLPLYCYAEEPGIVLIAGTGSIAVGIGADGGIVRAGGWNYSFSDLGSGTWIGKELLKETALYLDGCRNEDPAISCVLDKIGKNGEEALFALADIQDSDETASFARIVFENDSELSDRIKVEAADYLAQYVTSVVNRIETGGKKIMIVVSGGLTQNEKFRSIITDALKSKIKIHAEFISTNDNLFMGGINLAKKKLTEKGIINDH